MIIWWSSLDVGIFVVKFIDGLWREGSAASSWAQKYLVAALWDKEAKLKKNVINTYLLYKEKKC